MRVLMFGWEFPPHISGGLGTACYGITSSLLKNAVDVLFVVPRLFGDEDKNQFRFINATDIKFETGTSFYAEQLQRIKYIQVDSALIPYYSPEEILTEKETIHKSTFKWTEQNFAHFDFTGFYGKDLMKEVAQYAIVSSTIAKENWFDVIHAHDWLTFPAGIMAKQVSGKPLVVHVHATEFDRSGENINQAVYDIERKGMEEADAIITVSGLTKQILIDRYGVPAEKITIVHNGVLANENAVQKHTLRKKTKVVTFLGRVTFQKGPDYFVEAAAKVLKKFPEVQFVMAGSGDMLTRMIKRVAQLRIGSRFHFTGFLNGPEIQKMFDMSDVYVMPSVSEPFGISPLEAVRSGVPVIISKQSGVSEVLQNAVKVDFWDTDALANAICGLLQYKTLSDKFSKEAGKELEKITWDRAALKVKALYQSFLTVPKKVAV
jgi:glycogen synthase